MNSHVSVFVCRPIKLIMPYTPLLTNIDNALYPFVFIKSNHISFFRALVAGGGAPEIEASVKLMNYAKELTGKEAYCFKEFAQALEIIPYTLAENAGLSPIAVVTELRNKHAQGEKNYGINVRKVNDSAVLKYV